MARSFWGPFPIEPAEVLGDEQYGVVLDRRIHQHGPLSAFGAYGMVITNDELRDLNRGIAVPRVENAKAAALVVRAAVAHLTDDERAGAFYLAGFCLRCGEDRSSADMHICPRSGP